MVTAVADAAACALAITLSLVFLLVPARAVDNSGSSGVVETPRAQGAASRVRSTMAACWTNGAWYSRFEAAFICWACVRLVVMLLVGLAATAREPEEGDARADYFLRHRRVVESIAAGAAVLGLVGSSRAKLGVSSFTLLVVGILLASTVCGGNLDGLTASATSVLGVDVENKYVRVAVQVLIMLVMIGLVWFVAFQFWRMSSASTGRAGIACLVAEGLGACVALSASVRIIVVGAERFSVDWNSSVQISVIGTAALAIASALYLAFAFESVLVLLFNCCISRAVRSLVRDAYFFASGGLEVKMARSACFCVKIPPWGEVGGE
jgi:hypothetical protein